MESTEISAAKPKNGASASSARSLVEIRNDRESRTTEAMKMKDEQIRILTEQNNKLLDAIERGEEEISAIQLEKLHLEEENREVREQNFSVQSKRRFADDEFEKLKTSADEAEKELKVKKSQNTELLGALETEETTNAKMASEYESCKEELRELKIKCSSLERSSKSHEETSTRYSNEANVKSEEIRLLRSELDSLKHQFNEASMKYSVEVESLQEQLRVKKEKQYQLLMQLQGQEEARRKAEEKFVSAEDRLNFFHKKSSAAETQLQLEMSEKLNQSDLNKKLLQQNQELRARKNDLVTKLQKDEQDVLRLEAETRDNGDQLREMAEKLFQLLERLKLAEMGKTRSIEALRAKEEEVHDLKKRNTVLTKDNTKGGKVRLQAELDKKVIEDQLKELKKHNVRLGQRCKEEAKLKVRAVDQVKDLEQKVKKLDGRLSFLVNKIQTDEEAKILRKEELERIQKKAQESIEKAQRMQNELNLANKNLTDVSASLKDREHELEATNIKLDALNQLLNEQDKMREGSKSREIQERNDGNPLLAGGRLRFFVESKPTLGLVQLKAKCPKDREWIEINGCNLFFRKALKSQNTKEVLFQKIAETYGIVATLEEQIEEVKKRSEKNEKEIERMSKKLSYMHNRLSVEEESRRRTLLKYVNAVKASVSLGEPGSELLRETVGRIGAGRINLPEGSLGDEEAHAISAMLRGNQTIAELNLKGNLITDEGCRAIGSILSSPSALEVVDLSHNHISRNGIKVIVEALERSPRVQRVFVHVGGKVEALGQIQDKGNTTDTVCIVDLRNNSKKDEAHKIEGDLVGLPITFETDGMKEGKHIQTNLSNKNQKKESMNENQRRRKEKQHRDTMERGKQTRENGWIGRAGGLEVKTQKGLTNGSKCVNASKKPKTQDVLNSTIENCTEIHHEGEIMFSYNRSSSTAPSKPKSNDLKSEPKGSMTISPFSQDLTLY